MQERYLIKLLKNLFNNLSIEQIKSKVKFQKIKEIVTIKCKLLNQPYQNLKQLNAQLTQQKKMRNVIFLLKHKIPIQNQIIQIFLTFEFCILLNIFLQFQKNQIKIYKDFNRLLKFIYKIVKQNYMAFVINKSQIKSVFQTNNQNPGPGTYSSLSRYIQQTPAPFNSSVYKQSCFQTAQSNLGPGAYSKTSISQVYTTKNACGSSFKSRVKRPELINKNQLQYKDSRYQAQSQKSLLYCNNSRRSNTQNNQRSQILKQKKQNLNKIRRQNHQRKVNSIVQNDKQVVRVILSNPRNMENFQSFYVDMNLNIRDVNGPGKYDISSSMVQPNKKAVLDWSKYKQKRFNYKSQLHQNPGPGQYQLETKQKLRQTRSTSSFSYEGMRSYMDTIIYKTNNKIKAKIMETKKLKDKDPGPADYSPQKKGKNSHYYGKQILGSTVERFDPQKSKTTIPGPGYYVNAQCKYKYYGIMKEVRKKIFGKNNHLASTHHLQNFVPLQKQLQNKSQIYQHQTVVECPLKQRCHSKMGSLSKEQRFKNIVKSKQPGPGQYYNTKKSKKNTIDNSSIFKSNVERKPFQQTDSSLILPFYDLGKDDIAYKIQKKRQNLQNLKKVAIEKPPFDSKAQRFPIQKMNTSVVMQKKQQLHKIFHQDKIDYQAFKPYRSKPKYGSVFNSNTKRQAFQIPQNPGPGAYEYGDSINKKSFNAQYLGVSRSKAISTSKLYHG